MKKLTLQEQQKIILNILKYFHDFCTKHNIMYSLSGGTLIGAVRHKGFIPWDDDVDIYMLRDDYNKFVETWQKETHPHYTLSLLEDIKGFLTGEITKIFDDNTVLIDKNGRQSPLFIDIFIYDGVPNNPKLIYQVMKKHRRLKLRFTSCKKRWLRAKNNTLKQKLFKRLSYYFFNRMNENINTFIQEHPICDSDYIGLLLTDYGGWERSYMPKKYFSDVVYLEFEGEMYPCMNGYDEHLTMYYGDYMQLPPKEEQIPKHTLEAYYK